MIPTRIANHVGELVQNDDRAYSAGAIVRRQHAIKSVRSAATLQVAEHHTTRLFAGKRFEFSLTIGANAAEARRVMAVARVLVNQIVSGFNCAFSGHDDTEV